MVSVPVYKYLRFFSADTLVDRNVDPEEEFLKAPAQKYVMKRGPLTLNVTILNFMLFSRCTCDSTAAYNSFGVIKWQFIWHYTQKEISFLRPFSHDLTM